MPTKGRFLFDREQEADIAYLYECGRLALAPIGGLYDCHAQTVLLCLRRLGIERRTTGDACRRYLCDHSYFDLVDTEERAYWLGFLAADGNVRPNNAVRIALHDRDLGHLERFRLALNSNHPLRAWSSKTVHEIQISSPQMAAALFRMGCPPAKTRTLTLPPLQGALLRHWARGFSDGDGSFVLGQRAWEDCFKLTGNRLIIEGMRDYFYDNTLVSRAHLYVHKNRTDVCTIRYKGHAKTAIAEFLYRDATIYLERKYRKAFRL